MTSGSEVPPSDSEVVPRSIDRVLDILEVVLGISPCTLTSVAAAVELTPTTALRHLRALEARGYVGRDAAGRYGVGPTMLRLAGSIRHDDRLASVIAAAQPLLDRLADETGESAYLAIADGMVATYVAMAESQRAIRHVAWIGQNVSLDGTAVGAALAAPGVVMIRTGAVEADITALSRAIANPGRLGVAISVVGPRHRLGKAAQASVSHALVEATDRLADLAFGTSPASSHGSSLGRDVVNGSSDAPAPRLSAPASNKELFS